MRIKRKLNVSRLTRYVDGESEWFMDLINDKIEQGLNCYARQEDADFSMDSMEIAKQIYRNMIIECLQDMQRRC